jgi:hypothetical protein
VHRGRDLVVVAAAVTAVRGTFVRTAVVVLVCAGLGWLAWREFHKEGGGDAKEKALTFDKAKVSAVALARAGGETLRLLKQGQHWRLAAPSDVPAATSEVESLLSSLESLEVQEVVSDSPSSLQPFGLEPPATTATLTLEGAAEPLTLLLGDKTPDGTGVYAKRPAQPRLFTVPAFQAGALDKRPFDLRDRDLLHVARDDVRTLEVTGPEGDYALARGDDGEWSLTRPLKTRAGRWSVDSLLGMLESLRMDAVAAEQADDLEAYGLDKPARVVTVTLANGGVKKLEIGADTPDKKYHAREASSRLVAVIPGALVDDLAKGLGELRAKRLLDVSTYDVESIDARLDGKEFKHARTSVKDKDDVETYKWKRTAPDAKDLETSQVEDVLFKLTGLEVQEFVDQPGAPADYGFDAPELELTLGQGGGKPALKITLARKNGASYARRDGDDAVLKLDAAKVDEALKDLRGL